MTRPIITERTPKYTVIELCIGACMLGVLVVAVAVLFGKLATNPTMPTTLDSNGMVTTRCLSGYTFIVGSDGSARQVMDTEGHGVRCP